jgi:FkbM family methyltransferase
MDLFKDTPLLNSSLWELLQENPLTLVDVGARWGVSDLFLPISSLLNVVAFEPDDEEAKALEQKYQSNGQFRSFNVDNHGLHDHVGMVYLNLLARANNSSIYPVKASMYERYKLSGFELERRLPINVTTLDEYAKENPKFTPDVLKLDTQGAELAILNGAVNTLSSIKAVVVEAAFFSPYEGACNFIDVHNFLTQKDFTFYGYSDFQYRGTKRIDKKMGRSKERMMQADAIYFKDPIENNKLSFSRNEILSLIVLAALFEYYDFAAELVEFSDLEINDKDVMNNSIRNLHYKKGNGKKTMEGELKAISSLEKGEFNIRFGKLIDGYRDYSTYHEF